MIRAIVWTRQARSEDGALIPALALTGFPGSVSHFCTVEIPEGGLLAVSVESSSEKDLTAVGYGDAIARRLDGSKMIEARP